MKAKVLRPIRIGKKEIEVGSEIDGTPAFIALMARLKSVQPLEPFPSKKTFEEKIESITDSQIQEIATEVPTEVPEDEYSGYTLKKARATLKRRGTEHKKDANLETLIALLRK